MKRFIIGLLVIFCMSSCASTYGYTSTSTYDGYRISYTYEYYVNGVAYPVVYVNKIPYYYIGGYWYDIPVYRYSFIRTLHYPCYRYVNHYPRHRHHTHYYHGHNKYHNGVTHKPGRRPGGNDKHYKPNNRPNNNGHHYKPNNRPSKPTVRPGRNNSQRGGNRGGHRR